MVVFGAGASHDSLSEYPPREFVSFQQLSYPHLQNEPRRPPLAAQLFGYERFSQFFPNYPELLELFPQLDRVARSSGLEQRLAELVEESEGDPIIRQQMVELRYYIRDVVAWSANQWVDITRGADNYAELLGRIGRWWRRTEPKQQVALVTFNYDHLLDRALARVLHMDSGFRSMGDYIDNDDFKLLKVHGSVDWVRMVNLSATSRDPNAMASGIRFAADHPLPADADILTITESGGVSNSSLRVPAIAIPVQEKSLFELPNSHLDALRRYIDATTDLIVIGWRAMERHFLELWHAQTPPEYAPQGPPHLKRVLIVDKGEGAQVVEAQLRSVALVEASVESHTNGLSAFLQSGDLERFLSDVLLMPDRARV